MQLTLKKSDLLSIKHYDILTIREADMYGSYEIWQGLPKLVIKKQP